MFELKRLPYELDALEPYMSRETLEYHYSKHHRGYVDKLNSAIARTPLEEESLETIVRGAPDDDVFRNAAQAWNHEFFWHCLDPHATGRPEGRIAGALEDTFGSFDAFRDRFTDAALNVFGSGWAWLVRSSQGDLRVVTTSNAGTPITDNDVPLLTCDVWEHAYYIDHRNERPAYLEAYWKLVNWRFVESNLETTDPLADVERIVAAA